MTDPFLARRLRLALAGTLVAALPIAVLAQKPASAVQKPAAAASAAAVTTASGLVYTDVVEGKGPSPTAAEAAAGGF